MKKILAGLAVASLALGCVSTAVAGNVDGQCRFNGKRLYGTVQVVCSFPDIKVQFVDAFPDVKIQFVDAFPGKP